ncbi:MULTISPECIES: glycosyltransferase [unclassified Frondihabitans]|uniref:glycosyltransferase n=1 Tax=unclassified Frondihabitans TaxID=2626248 RepID=UPI000F4EF9A5|nr:MULTISPECIES: glycosyltransferase [unclassified Frondihabitans]RPE78340.1 D-inositol-3-phosphate glycosyltransferase [Frondihabitans sp. PhB153]RPF08621.1 D-inositol-3-phosphate glycosyltransferase [Frondihabitans sp. PhB161]
MPDSRPDALRIALVCLHTSPASDPGIGDAGGMNVVVRNQAAALGALGHHVDVLTRRSSPDQPATSDLGENVVLRFLDAGPPEPVAKGVHENFIGEFQQAMEPFGPYDIIHSHHWFSGMAALPFARARGLAHLQSFHSIAADHSTPLSEGERPESPGRLTGEAWLAKESDGVIAISAAEAETVVHRLGADAENVHVVSPGVDATVFRPAAPGSVAPSPYVVAAGRLDPLKGFDLAIAAVAAIPESIRPDLVIAGEESVDYRSYPDELRALAESLGVADRVRFVGPQSRSALAALLREARVAVVPSHSETYGLVALEAAASGTPVVAAAAGGLREAVVDGVTGIVLRSREPAVWADAIAGILGEPVYAAALSTAARVRAAGLSWAHSADGLVACYRSLAR